MRKIFTFITAALMTLNVMAQLPYNTTMTQSHYNNGSTVTKKEGQQKWENGVRLGTTGLAVGNWDDKYIVVALDQTSIPNQLTFKYKCNSVIATNPDWYVEESADNSNWSRIWSAVTPTSSGVSVSTSTYSASVTLSKSTKYLKLCYSGNYSGTFSDVKVTDQAYVNDPVANDQVISSLDFGTGSISSGEEELSFDVEWCNVDVMTVTSDNETFFSVTPSSFGGKVQYGTQTVTVTYNRNVEVGTHTGNITISNGSVTKTVALSGATALRAQGIHWNADLTATNFTLNAEDALTAAEAATADNEEAVITFASDNEEVIAVSEDRTMLNAVANGTATITVYATGNDIYAAGEASQVFTVTSHKKQSITWEQNFMGLKTDANPNTITLEATATSGGMVTYAIEDGSDACVTLGGENNATMTITGTPGTAYIIASQAGGMIEGEEWIAVTARKQVKVRDPQSACDEYALADQSFTFAQGHKSSDALKEYSLVGKPTQLTFTAKAGGKQYIWSEREAIFVDQYANFGSGLEWRQVVSLTLDENSKNYGPYALEETATKIRFRTRDYSEQTVTNISTPRKKELLVSETLIEENAERNVRWSKTISVSRSNIDAVDIIVESTDPNNPFAVSKTSIGTDCADYNTETFEVYFTPRDLDSVYTGTITITDGKAVPTTHTIDLRIKATRFNQTIQNFTLPASCLTTDTIEVAGATATSNLEVVYLSSDSAIAYVENNRLVILSAGSVEITAYQPGDERFSPASQSKTIVINHTPVTVTELPTAAEVAYDHALGMALLFGGSAVVENTSEAVAGTFAWADPEQVLTESGEYAVVFTPVQNAIYATATVNVPVTVTGQPATYGYYTAEFCEGDSVEFDGKWYNSPAEEEPLRVTLEQKNIFDGDSIVFLTLIVKYPSASEETKTIVYGATEEWNGIALSDYMVGEHQVEYVTTNAVGCDSTITLHLTVLKQDVVIEPVALSFCQGGEVEYRGNTYTEAGNYTLEAAGAERDTLFQITVTELQPSETVESLTIQYGDKEVWNGIDLSTYAVGDYTEYFNTVNAAGCDSVVTLILSVEKMDDYETEQQLALCEGDSIEYRGVWYKEADTYEVHAEGQIRDTVIAVIVNVYTVENAVERMTVAAGDTIALPEGEWIIGEKTVSGKYPTSEADVPELVFVQYGQSEEGCKTQTDLIVTVSSREGMENISADKKAEKFMRDGKLFIRRGEAIYTATGERVE